ncbi:MAG: GntR family transcriptional regulator [Planctomycetaceae bacterium]
MHLRVDPASDTPPSRQIVEALLDAIAAATLASGARLPSVRALAAEALVNPNTVSKAYREMEALGVVESRSGLGVFVTPRGPGIAKGARRRRTLDAFRRAACEATRAGHEPAELERILQHESAGGAREGRNG